MAAVRLRAGIRFQTNEKVFEIQKVLFGGTLQVMDLKTGLINSIDEQYIKEQLFNGDLKFEVFGKDTKKPEKGKLRTDYKYEDFSKVPEKYRQKAWCKFIIVKECLKIPKEMRNDERLLDAMKKGIKALADNYLIFFKKPHKRTVKRWLNDFIYSGGDIRSLVDDFGNCGARGVSRLTPEVNQILTDSIEAIHMREERPTAEQVNTEVINRIKEANESNLYSVALKPPCKRTINYRISRLNPYESMAARYGKERADEFYRSVGGGVVPARVWQRVEFDDTTFHLMIVDDEDRLPIGRPTFGFSMEAKADYPGGFYLGFEPPSAQTVMECLKHTILPKDYVKSQYPFIKNTWDSWGLMEEIVIDLGKPYQSWDLEYACSQLHIDILDCPVKTPYFKPKIERQFQTINTGLLQDIPGVTFGNIFDKGDYDPEKNAVISLREFLAILHIWLIDIYSYKFNRGIKGIPAKKWHQGISEAPVAYPPSRQELTVLLSSTEHRVIQKRGIELHGIFYNDPVLGSLRKAHRKDAEKHDFEIKFNKWDLSHVWLYDDTRKDGGRYLKIPAIDKEYTSNLSLYKHRIICDFIKKEEKDVYIFSLAAAKRIIQRIVQGAYTTTHKTRTRKKLARYMNMGPAPWRESEDFWPSKKPVRVAKSTAPMSDRYAGISDRSALHGEWSKPNGDITLEGVNKRTTESSSTRTKKTVTKLKQRAKSDGRRANEEESTAIQEEPNLSGWRVDNSLQRRTES